MKIWKKNYKKLASHTVYDRFVYSMFISVDMM